MSELLMRSWWALAARGVLAIVVGVAAFLIPAAALLALVGLFALFAIVSGASAMAGALRHRGRDPRWSLLFALGAVSLIAGIWAVFVPGLTILVFVLLMSANALITGVLDIVIAIRLRERIEREWLLVIAGAVSVLFGALVLIAPAGGALALAWLFGAYFLVYGVLSCALAIRLKRVSRRRRAAAIGAYDVYGA